MIRFLQTPSAVKKYVLGGLLLVICGAMVVTLVPGGILGGAFGAPGQGVVAKVGDQEIMVAEVQQSARRLAQQQFAGRAVPPGIMPYFMQQSLQNLIMSKAMAYEAGRLGLEVTDKELIEWLRTGPFSTVLFPDGQFIGSERYEEFTERNLNMTVPQFEQAVKDEILTTKFRNLVAGSATVTPDELRQQYVKKNTKVRFDYAVLTTEDVTKQLHPSEAELQAFYTANQKRYENSIPEKRQIDAVVVTPVSVRNRVQVTPADLKNYYDSHMDQYRVPEEVKARHILIKTPAPGPDGKVDEKAVAAAHSKAEDLLKKLKAGGNFAELAKKFSEDPGSGQQGGELGWFKKGAMVPEFEQAAFSLQPGQISDLVKTTYGFHIIQVEEKHTARLKPLDEVKAQIEPLIVIEKGEGVAGQVAQQVVNDARSSTLAAAAAKHGLQVVNMPPVTRTDSAPGIGPAPELMTAAFAAKEKNPPELVKMAQGYAIFVVNQIIPAASPTFEAVKPQVEAQFKQQRASQLLDEKLQQLADRAHAEHDLKKAAAEVGAQLKTSDLVGVDSQVPEVGSLAGPAAVVFDMKPGDISAPIEVPRGGAVISLLERQEPGLADFESQRDGLRQTLLAEKREQLLQLFLENLQQRLEKSGKLRQNKQELDRLFPKQAGF